MNEYDREDFTYLLELAVEGMTDRGYEWVNDQMAVNPERMCWLIALAAEMVDLAAIDKKTANTLDFPEIIKILEEILK